MTKFQQGGVRVFNIPHIPPTNVGDIPVSPDLHLPAIHPLDLTALTNLSQDRITRKAQYDNLLAKQQASQLGADQKQYFALRHNVFGDYDNAAQGAVINAVAQKYGAIDDIKDLPLDNTVILKPQIAALQKAATDHDMMKTYGEIEAARKYLAMSPPPNANLDELNKARSEYFNQQLGQQFDVRRLNPQLYAQPKPTTPDKNFDNIVAQTAQSFGATTDFTDPTQAAQFGKAAAYKIWLEAGQEGLDRGIIAQDPNNPNQYIPGPNGQGIMTNGVLARQAYVIKNQDAELKAIKLLQERGAITRANQDHSRAAKVSGSSIEDVANSDAVAAIKAEVENDNTKTDYINPADIDKIDFNLPAVRGELRNLVDTKGDLNVSVDKKTRRYTIQQMIKDTQKHRDNASIESGTLLPAGQLFPTDGSAPPAPTQVAPVVIPSVTTPTKGFHWDAAQRKSVPN